MEEIAKALAEINGKLDILNNKYDTSAQEMEFLRSENKIMQQKLEIQEERMEYLEKQIREKKIIIHGIKEEENESFVELRDKTVNVIQHIGAKISKENDIIEVRRMGKQREDKERPIQVDLATCEMKREIFRKKKQLKGQNIWIKEDLPEYVRQQRRNLGKILKEERDKGNKAYFAYNKLIVNGKVYIRNDRKDGSEQRETKVDTPLQRKENTRTYSQRSPDEAEINQEKEKVRVFTKTASKSKN